MPNAHTVNDKINQFLDSPNLGHTQSKTITYLNSKIIKPRSVWGSTT